MTRKQHTTARTCQAGRLVGAVVLLVGRLAAVVKQAEAGVQRPLGKLRGAGVGGAKGAAARNEDTRSSRHQGCVVSC